MPDNSNLQWIEVRDFSPGLWEQGDWLLPAGAATTLTDAYPQEGGGLRAFFKKTAMSMTGIGAGEFVSAIYGAWAQHRSLAGSAIDFYCVTYAGGTPKLYRYDQTDSAQTGWTLMKTFATVGTGPSHEAQILGYTRASDGHLLIVASISNGGADDAIWYADQTVVTGTQTWTKISGTVGGPIAIHQNRLCEGNGSKVVFSGPGDLVMTTGYVDIEPQRTGRAITFMIPQAPGDLIVGKEGASWAVVQGDLTDPTIRTLSEAHPPGHADQTPADTGMGLAFMEEDGGIYLTDMGSSFQRLDKQLIPPTRPSITTHGVFLGDLAFFKRFLFAPRGYVFDTDTKAWFKISALSGVYSLFVEHVARTIYLVDNTATAVYTIMLLEGDSRVSTYTWKSPALRDPSGRQIRIREVQLALKTYNAASTVAVTVNGVTRTSPVLAAGRQTVSFLFKERDEVLDVEVVPNSNDAAVEAPSIEVVRIGTAPGHLTK